MQASYAPRTYWVDDPIDNFRLRVTLYQDGPERADAASLPTQPERADEKESLLGGVSRRRRRARKGDERAAQEASFASQEHASYDSPAAAAPGTRANPYVREFAWQEKVIGPAEVRAYRERERRSALGQGIEALGTGLRSLFAQPAPDTSFRDRSYAEQIAALDDEAQAATGRPFAGEVLHSKVHVDRFVDRRELRARMTTSELEEPSPLTHAVLSGRALEPLPLAPARPGVPAPTPPPYQLMHIVADLGERSQPASAAARARAGEDDDDEQAGPDRTLFVLCTLRAYANGRLDMTPGFSNEGVELEPDLDESGAPPPPGGGAAAGLLAGGGAGGGARAKGWHRLTARDGKVWRFRLDNLAERLVSETERRAERGARVHELIARQNPFGGGTAFTPPPPKGAVVLNVLGELVGAHGFDAASLSAQYFVHVNEGWTVSASSSVHGMTQACLPKWVPAEREYEHIVHFGLPLELTLSNPSWGARGGADDGAGAGLSASGAGSTAAATLFVQLLSRDRFDRHMVEGYGHVAIAPSAGACTHRVRTWRPAASAAASVRRFFVHEGDEISDLRYVGVPSGVPSKGLNKYGFASEKAGTVVIRLSCITQQAQPKPAPQQHSDERGSAGHEGLARGGTAASAGSTMSKADRVRMKLEQRAREREAAAERARTAASERLSTTRPSTAASIEGGASLRPPSARSGPAADRKASDELEAEETPSRELSARGRRARAARRASTGAEEDRDPAASAGDDVRPATTPATGLGAAAADESSESPLVKLS